MNQKHTNTVKQFYDQAGEYFSHTRKYIWPEVKPYLDKLKDKDKILDVGCGNGRLLTGISSKVNYTGIDFSSTLLTQAKKLHPKTKFINGDLTKLSAWKNLGKFDAIFCIAVIHHISTRKDQLFILKQISNHLNKNGFAYISVWNLWQPKYLKHHLSVKSLKLKLANWRWLYFPFQNQYLRFCTALDLNYLNNLAHQVGFKVIKTSKTKNLTIIVR